MVDDFDPARFAIPNGFSLTTRPPQRTGTPPKPKRREFVKGIDLAWFVEALKLNPSAAKVAVAIAFRHGLEGEPVVRPRQHDYEKCGLNRNTRCKGIKALEAAGLIRKLNPGTNQLPEVEMVLPPESDTTDE